MPAADAWDCHMHVFEPGVALAPTALNTPPDAPAALWAERFGAGWRPLVVQPSHYGLDNRATLAAAEALGGRAVVVVGPGRTDAELRALGAAGAIGARFHLARNPPVPASAIPEVGAMIAPLGWSLHVQMAGDDLAEALPMLRTLPCDVVIEHFGRPRHPADPRDPAVLAVLALLGGGRAWVKLSAADLLAAAGDPADPAIGALARRYAAAAPGRVLWGSNWPHPNRSTPPPEDAAVLAAPRAWFADDQATLDALLRGNPRALFAASGPGRPADAAPKGGATGPGAQRPTPAAGTAPPPTPAPSARRVPARNARRRG